MLEIIYQDEYLVAINKPHGLLVHRSSIAADATEFALQMLRDQLQRKVYLVHRIDRKTSGILVFAFDPKINAVLGKSWSDRAVIKTYLAVVRGWLSEKEGVVDYPLTTDEGKTQDAVTRYKSLHEAEIGVPLGKFQTSRYTLLEVYPETGRMHQIRKHMNHLRHPIIGDRPYGCSKQNRLWKSRWNMTNMMLHAHKLTFEHPTSKEQISLCADISEEMKRVMDILKLPLP